MKQVCLRSLASLLLAAAALAVLQPCVADAAEGCYYDGELYSVNSQLCMAGTLEDCLPEYSGFGNPTYQWRIDPLRQHC
jgi:hypothetical protein